MRAPPPNTSTLPSFFIPSFFFFLKPYCSRPWIQRPLRAPGDTHLAKEGKVKAQPVGTQACAVAASSFVTGVASTVDNFLNSAAHKLLPILGSAFAGFT